MSRKSGLRKRKTKLALQWVDEQFDVPIQASPVRASRVLRTPRAIVLLEPAIRKLGQPRVAKR